MSFTFFIIFLYLNFGIDLVGYLWFFRTLFVKSFKIVYDLFANMVININKKNYLLYFQFI